MKLSKKKFRLPIQFSKTRLNLFFGCAVIFICLLYLALNILPNSIRPTSSTTSPDSAPQEEPQGRKIPDEKISTFPPSGRTLEEILALHSDELKDKTIEYVDVNKDGYQDIKIEDFNNKNREAYYYFLHSQSETDTYHRMYYSSDVVASNSEITSLGENIYFIKDYIISVQRDGQTSGESVYKIDGYAYAAGDETFRPGLEKDIELIWFFQPQTMENPTSMEEIMGYVEWLDTLRNSPAPQHEGSKSVSFKEARKIILKEGFISGFVPHEPGDASFTTFSGSYTVTHDPNDDFWSIIKECGEKCKYGRTALE